MKTRFLLFAATALTTIAGFSPVHGADPPEAPKATDAAYQNALVAAIHRLSESSFDSEQLAVLLERHPKLVNELVTYKQPRKPLVSGSYTALHLAARAGNSDGVKILLAFKADPNALAGSDWTPLHVAAQRGQLSVVKLLVEAGAKTDAKTAAIPEGVAPSSDPGADGKPRILPAIPAMTPLELAKNGKHKDVIEYLSNLK